MEERHLDDQFFQILGAWALVITGILCVVLGVWPAPDREDVGATLFILALLLCLMLLGTAAEYLGRPTYRLEDEALFLRRYFIADADGTRRGWATPYLVPSLRCAYATIDQVTRRDDGFVHLVFAEPAGYESSVAFPVSAEFYEALRARIERARRG